MTFDAQEMLYLFLVGFFLFAALDMLRRLFNARFSYEQIRPKSLPTRWIFAISASLILGLGFQWVKQNIDLTISGDDQAKVLMVDKSPNGAIGGMAWLNDKTLLIARDSKNYGKRLLLDRIATIDMRNNEPVLDGNGNTVPKSKLPEYAQIPLAVVITGGDEIEVKKISFFERVGGPFAKELLPSDLEAVCIPKDTNLKQLPPNNDKHTIIATESSQYKTDRGHMYLIEVSEVDGKWQGEIIGMERLPLEKHQVGTTGESNKFQIEGIACFAQDQPNTTTPATAERYTVLLGYRGKHAIGDLDPSEDYQGSIALVTDVDFNLKTPLKNFEDLGAIPVKGERPKCIGPGLFNLKGEWRDISDLHVMSNGQIWAARAFEGNDPDDPSCSTVYRFPRNISHNGTAWELSPVKVMEEEIPIAGYKVEAVIGKKPGSSTFIYAYDNEDLGSGILSQ